MTAGPLNGAPSRSAWISGSAWNFVAAAAGGLALAVVGILVARALGPRDFGIFATITVASSLVSSITTFRLDIHLLVELGRHRRDDRATYNTTVGASYLLTIPACIVAAIAVLGAPGNPYRVAMLAEVGSVMVAPLLLSRSALQVYRRQRTAATVSLAARSSWVLAALAIVELGPRDILSLLFLAGLATDVLEASLLSKATRLPMFGWLIQVRRSLGARVRVLRQSWPLMVSGLTGTVYNRVDQLLLTIIAGPAATGLYAAAVRLTETLNMIPAAVQAVTTPSLSGIRRSNNQPEFTRALRDTTLVMCVPGALGAAILVGTGNQLVTFLFGGKFSGSGWVVTGLAFATIPVFAGTAITSGALAVGNRRAIALATSIAAVVNVVGNLALIPIFGGVGAAWVSAASYAIAVVLTGVASRDLYPHIGPAASAALVCLMATAAGGAAGLLVGGGLLLSAGTSAVSYAVVVGIAFRDELPRVVRLVQTRRTRRKSAAH
jgi:polysaccharide transporter, PST family